MTIAIHPVHRRLAELSIKAKRVGGVGNLSPAEFLEMLQCLQLNADFVQKVDGYKEAAYAAHCNDQMDLALHFSAKLDELEAKCT